LTASTALLPTLGAAAIVYGEARHGDIPTVTYKDGSTILGFCPMFGCETYDSTGWFVAGGGLILVAIVLAALALLRARRSP
jgi:hypothetical protein